jgi:HTH-type transcriptional regulator / antitoxin HigA
METMSNNILSDVAIPPGEYLQEILDNKGMTQKDFALRMGRPLKTINGIIKGKVRIIPDTAVQIENVLGVSAKFWMSMENEFQLTKAHIKELEGLKEQLGFLKIIPIKELIKRKWIEHYEDKGHQLREVLRFLGIASIYDLKAAYPSVFRSSAKAKICPEVIALWLRKGQCDAESSKLDSYNPTLFKNTYPKFRALTREEPEIFVPKLKKQCADAGVGFILVPELPKCAVNGAAYWINGNPFIQLNIRGKYSDKFWFDFFHEICHIIKHSKNDVFIDCENEVGKIEDEANEFASDILIPQIEFKEIADIRIYSESKVKQFAERIGIHPGIVVGRLQHVGFLPPTYLNKLRSKFEWNSTE